MSNGDGPALTFNQRVAEIGMNRSGKSTHARWIFVQMRVRRVLVDPKGEWRVKGVPRVDLDAAGEDEARAKVQAIDWAAPIIHVKPAWRSPAVLVPLFERIAALRGGLFVWIDEAYGVSSASWAPDGLFQLLVAGAGRGQGVIAATQRPRNVAKEFITESDHVILWPPLDVEDLKESLRGSAFLPLPRAIELLSSVPEYGYLWIDRRRKRVAIGPPLPAELRAYRADQIDKA